MLPGTVSKVSEIQTGSLTGHTVFTTHVWDHQIQDFHNSSDPDERPLSL